MKDDLLLFFEYIWDIGVYLMCLPLVNNQEPFYISRFFSLKNEIINYDEFHYFLYYNDMTLLHYSVKKNMLLYCKALIKYGFEINFAAHNGITPKYLADTIGTPDIKALFDSVQIQV